MTETFNHSHHSEQVYGSKTYEDLENELRSCHFTVAREVKNQKIISLHVEASATILIDSKVERLREILKDWTVGIHPMKNEGYIKITLEK